MLPPSLAKFCRLFACCVLALLPASCERTPPAATPEDSTGQAAGSPAPSTSPRKSTSSTPGTVAEATGRKTWQDIPVDKPEDRITVHYHRADGRYAEAGIWTWDATPAKKTPTPNELDSLGEDDFGAVFQLDRAQYGGSGRIGLIPRTGRSWSSKDGGDRFWTPALGTNEVWLVQKEVDVFTSRPDLSLLVSNFNLDDRQKYFDGDARLGATYSPQAIVFRVFAPTASAASVVLYDGPTGGKGRAAYSLHKAENGLWEGRVAGDLPGKFYAYRFDGPQYNSAREVLDPYAANSVASGTRARLGDPGRPPQHPGPRVASPADMVVYEMHVRDFTIAPNSGVRARGLYLGFTEPNTRLTGDIAIRTALDHLSELGVTHVQLFPVQDYEGDESHPNYNWGYATTAYFSPEGAYATNPNDDSRVRELKALVDALHARGIGVIMDVVYNHTANNAPFPSLVPRYYYRHQADGSLADGAACGNEFRTEAPMARKLIIDSLVFWAREYGFDGFRFDLMALLDQETMREAEKALEAVNPSIVLYGEPWKAASSPLGDGTDKGALYQVPVGAFNDDFRNALKGSPDGKDPGFIQNGSHRDALKAAMSVSSWLSSPEQSVNYMTCHDNLVLWDKLKSSMPGAGDSTLVQTMKLGYLALLTSPGVPFFQGGEEFARSKGGNNNSYNAPDSVNQVDWSLKRKNYGLFTYTRDVITLRKGHPVFRLRTRDEVAARLKFLDDAGGSQTLVYTLDGAGVAGETWKAACVVLNSDGQAPADVTLPGGSWTIALDDRGLATFGHSVNGKVSVPPKSGLVLYQR